MAVMLATVMVEILEICWSHFSHQYWTNPVPICEATNGPIQSISILPLFKPIFGQYWTDICELAGKSDYRKYLLGQVIRIRLKTEQKLSLVFENF